VEVIDALLDLQVTNNDHERDGFQMRFSLGRDSPLDYGLLLNGYFDPPARTIVAVVFAGLPQVLIDGVITSHQVVPSNKPGESTLIVTGEDITLMMDLEEKNDTFPNQLDSLIVTRILSNYATYGLVPMVTATTDLPLEVDRVPNQQGTDLTHVREL